MIITFCGHGDYVRNAEDEQKVLEILERELGDNQCEFFLGEYGSFDSFAHICAKKFKAAHPKAWLVFVTPYIDEKYIKTKTEFENDFDNIVYPPIENVPKKFAISHRNRWMVENSDIVIACISHAYGGAYNSYKHAMARGKKIYNISGKDVE
ncbi:MAG: hypothetical protein IJX74_05050 [Clostridia bacterium]|nr:hypothetical protein [Clostridia bacterium]